MRRWQAALTLSFLMVLSCFLWARTPARPGLLLVAIKGNQSLGIVDSATNQKLAEARSESTVASRYDGWRGEKAELQAQIDALQKDRDVAMAKAAQAEAKAADVVRKAAAAATQAKADDPEYAAAVREREAKRAGGR